MAAALATAMVVGEVETINGDNTNDISSTGSWSGGSYRRSMT
jgi:hypothetical protein